MSWRLVPGGPKTNHVDFPLNRSETNYEGHKVTWENVHQVMLREKSPKSWV